jgi:arginine decarboxylase
VWGAGDAGTPLSAFDTALASAGSHNYNLVTCSSVVPPGRPISRVGRSEAEYGVCAPVGVVLAATETTASETVAAGLGWIRAAEGGVLMEGSAGSAATVRTDLREKLSDARRSRDWDRQGDPEPAVHEHAVDETGAVAVAAVYGPLVEAEGAIGDARR